MKNVSRALSSKMYGVGCPGRLPPPCWNGRGKLCACCVTAEASCVHIVFAHNLLRPLHNMHTICFGSYTICTSLHNMHTICFGRYTICTQFASAVTQYAHNLLRPLHNMHTICFGRYTICTQDASVLRERLGRRAPGQVHTQNPSIRNPRNLPYKDEIPTSTPNFQSFKPHTRPAYVCELSKMRNRNLTQGLPMCVRFREWPGRHARGQVRA